MKLSMASPYAFLSENQVIIGNNQVEARFNLQREPSLASIKNKLTNRNFNFVDTHEFVVRLATKNEKTDVPEWLFHAGSGESMENQEDLGFREEFFQPDLNVQSWMPVQRLNDFPVGAPGYSPVLYPGFGWYRAMVEVSTESMGKPIEFVLGGNDNHDWLEYWIYLNGVLIGNSKQSIQAHDSPKFVLENTDRSYESIKFGGSNLLVVQGKGLNRVTPNMTFTDIERYSVGSFLVDQYLSAGPAMEEVSDFELVDYTIDVVETKASLQMQYVSLVQDLKMEITYWVYDNEISIQKQIKIENIQSKPQILLELDILQLQSDQGLTPGGMGIPSILGGEIFCGIKHPAGVSTGSGTSLLLRTFPGKQLDGGQTYLSKVAIFGVGERDGGQRAFVEFLEKNGPRKRKMIQTFNSYGIYDVASIENPTYMTEESIFESLDHLQRLKERGVNFDYYYLDTGWNNPSGDLIDFDPVNFPNGPSQVLEKIDSLGMKVGLWTSPAGGPAAFYPGVFNQLFAPCGTLPKPLDVDPKTYRGVLCIAASPWKERFKDALHYHVKVNNITGFKFDGNEFFCTNSTHEHLSGKYSLEHLMDTMLEVLESLRKECPDIMYMFYWNIRSPWWLLYGDTIYERGILMEGSTPSDFPTRILRQSITLSYDQAVEHAWDLVPLACGDSLGVWISEWRWANYIKREGWQDAWIMEIARGSLLYQLWGNLSFFDQSDFDFLEFTSKWLSDKSYLLQYPKRILGDPWKGQTYGYSYFDSEDGAIFIYNPSFENRTIQLTLEDQLKFIDSNMSQMYEVSEIYSLEGSNLNPVVSHLTRDDQIEIELKPFEVKLFQISTSNSDIKVLPKKTKKEVPGTLTFKNPMEEIFREGIAWEDPSRQSVIQKLINGRAQYVDTAEGFKTIRSKSDERDRKVTRRIIDGEIQIPPLVQARTLLVSALLTRDSIFWHHAALFEILKLRVTSNESELFVKTTPDRWHEEAGGWSWILFEIPFTKSSTAHDIHLQLEAYLPEAIKIDLQIRLHEDRK